LAGPNAATDAVEQANAEVALRLCQAEPTLVDVRPALDVVPGMTPGTILTSGAPLAWEEYTGGQRDGIIGAALFEGLASTAEEAIAALDHGDITVASCQEHACIGSLAGIYTASMPVFVVDDPRFGTRAFCNLFEGPLPKRLNYGVYDEEVKENLLHLERSIAPTLAETVRRSGGIPLRPIIRRALNMGDELHSRNTAATLLFTRELFRPLLDLESSDPDGVRRVLDYIRSGDYFFLRLAMAAAKGTADGAHGFPSSSVVTSMAFNCKDYAIRVSGLGDEWFRGPLPSLERVKLFEGHSRDEIEFMGGESTITETVGLGGMAQAAAFPLVDYQGGSAEEMAERNRSMYEITVAEHPEFRIPFLNFRGVPVGIDVRRVAETGIAPAIDIAVAGRGGGQIGAGAFRAPLECFEAAATAHNELVAEVA
jgi:hypothetical protein